MTGQMCWLSQFGREGDKILHLRLHPNHPWLPYNSMPSHAVPDYEIPGGSRGYATFQQLLKAGWVFIPSAAAYEGQRIAS